MSDNDNWTYEDYIRVIDHIVILIGLSLFLLIKFLKYRTANEKFKLKKASSVFNSVESPSPK
jgi:hypothetical protein